jgi:hypothetical protein
MFSKNPSNEKQSLKGDSWNCGKNFKEKTTFLLVCNDIGPDILHH